MQFEQPCRLLCRCSSNMRADTYLEHILPDNWRLRSQKADSLALHQTPSRQKHCWTAQPFTQTSCMKRGCPACAGQAPGRCNSLQALYPDIAAEWDHSKNNGQPSNHPASSHHLAWWSSLQHGSWQQTIDSHTQLIHQRTARQQRFQQRQISAL